MKFGQHCDTDEAVAIKVTGTGLSHKLCSQSDCSLAITYCDRWLVIQALVSLTGHPFIAPSQILDKESLVKSGLETKIKQEIRILKFLRHPNVVELKEVMASRQKIYMVMELVPGGELFDKIVAEGPMSVRSHCHTPCLVLVQNNILTVAFTTASRHGCDKACKACHSVDA